MKAHGCLHSNFRYKLCIFILIAGLSATGCARHTKSSHKSYPWFSSLRENVVTTVPDTNRAKDLLVLINDLEEVVMESSAAAEPHRRKLLALNADYDASRQDFLAVRENMDNINQSATSEIVTMRVKMKSLLTPEEWQKIMKNQETLFESAIYHQP